MIRALALAVLAGAVSTLFLPWPSAGEGSRSAGLALRWLAVAAVLLLPSLHDWLSRQGRPRLVRSAVLAAALLCGAALSAGEVVKVAASRWPEALADTEVRATGVIVSLPRTVGSYGARPVMGFDVRLERLECLAGEPDCVLPDRLPVRMQVVDGASGKRYVPGDRWRWNLRLRPPDGSLNPGSFDRERWLLSPRIDAVATVRAGSVRRLSAGTGSPRGWLGRQRLRLAERLIDRPVAEQASRHGDPQVIAALALGRGDLITPAWRERLQHTGTSHLIAISGLHVGLVFALFIRLAGVADAGRSWAARVLETVSARFARQRDAEPSPMTSPSWTWPRIGADGIGWCAAAGYAALSGFGLPVQRALVMLLVLVLLRRRARRVAPGTSLALAVIAVLLLDPLAPLSSGFWLSAGAVAMLIWCATGRVAAGSDGWRARWVRTLGAQLWLSALLIPVGAWAFQQVSTVSAPVNLLAIPFVGIVVVPVSLAGTVLMAAGLPGADALLSLALATVAMLRHALDAAAAVPGASRVATLPDLPALLLCVGGIVLCGVVVAARLRLAWGALLPVMALPALLWGAFGHPVRDLEVHVLDVGHGLAVLVLTPERTVLFDTGGGRGEAVRARRVVMPYLHALGRRRIDRLVISHLDADHAAGLPWLAQRFPAMTITVPDIAAARERLVGIPAGSRLRSCRAGQGFELDGVSFDFLHPAGHDAGSRNDRSCVALVGVGGTRLLFSGDIEAAAERTLVRRAGGVPVHVLFAPHHGSDSSSSAAFVQAFPARDVVFATARRSRWGFPHATVRMRYKTSGARLHTVGRTGALVFRFDASAAAQASADCCAPVSARQAARRLWRQP